MASVRLLLVDDDESVRSGLQGVLEACDFEVVAAPNANEALQRIANESFDVLLTDLHMPGAGDGLTVISAMRHAHPKAITLLLSANPDLTLAAAAIQRQVDEIMRKPVKVGEIVSLIRQRLAGETSRTRPDPVQPVANILESETPAITHCWLAHLRQACLSSHLPHARELSVQERCEHLPDALRDIIFRLRYPQPLGSTSVFSMAALQHGARRRRQGVGAATLAEESRALQVALFEIIQNNLDRMDLGQLPGALMAIADEVNAQLLQGLAGYENEQPSESYGFRHA